MSDDGTDAKVRRSLVPDTRVEQWLNRHGVSFHVEYAVPLGQFDWPRCQANQARPELLDETFWYRYFSDALDGMITPPLVVYRDDNGKLVNIDGNHRLKGLIEAESTDVDVYVVDTSDDRLIQLLTRVANVQLNGKEVNDAENLENAKYLHRSCGYTLEKAADECKIKPDRLQAHLQADAARERLIQSGVPAENLRDIPLGVLQNVESLPTNVARAVLDARRQVGMNAEDVAGMIKYLRLERDEAPMLQIIEEHLRRRLNERMPDGRQRLVNQREPYVRLFEYLDRAYRVVHDARTLIGLGCTTQGLRGLLNDKQARLNDALAKIKNDRGNGSVHHIA